MEELGIARLSLEDTPASVLPPRRPAFGHAGDEALAAEVYERMLERELEVRTWVPCGGYWSANGLLDRRDKVVDWLYGATEALNMDAFVLHLAVHYMDWTMLAVSVAAADMQLLAMVCAYAAAKFHGPEHVVPCLKLVQELARAEGPEGAEQVKAMELKVLFALEWRLNAVTALHIADHHLALGAIVPADECGAADRRQLATKLRQFTDFFLLQTLYDHRFLQSRASHRCAARPRSPRRGTRSACRPGQRRCRRAPATARARSAAWRRTSWTTRSRASRTSLRRSRRAGRCCRRRRPTRSATSRRRSARSKPREQRHPRWMLWTPKAPQSEQNAHLLCRHKHHNAHPHRPSHPQNLPLCVCRFRGAATARG